MGDHTGMGICDEQRPDELGHARPMILALLRGYRSDGRGYREPAAVRLELASDRYLLFYPDDAEMRGAWAGFYRRVNARTTAVGT
jgi:hypothetical protein